MRAPAALIAGLLVGLAAPASGATVPPEAAADMVIVHGAVWTGDDAQPHAQAVAIKDGRILKVGRDREVLALAGPATRRIDAQGHTVAPGFIDAHTHFETATEWFFQVRLAAVSDDAALAAQLKAAAARVPPGLWITGGDWDTAAARAAGRAATRYAPFRPSLAAVDAVTQDHPVLIRRQDGAYFMNSKGFALLHLDRLTPNPAGGEFQRDPATGELTGLLLGRAGERVASMLPPISRARTLIGARAALKELNGHGITGIHDIGRVDAISQTRLFHADVERSFTDTTIFEDLRKRGELSVRVYPLLALNSWKDLAAHGVTPGSGDEMIHYGGLKFFVDGWEMFAPFDNNAAYNRAYAGGLTFRVVDGPDLERDIVGADRLGFDPAGHVIGDKGAWELLNWYEAAIRVNGPRDRRVRLIHAWYPALAEIQRAGRMHAIADITPQQFFDDMDVLDARLGPERVRTAYAWRTMIDNGLRLDIVSDWPGSYNDAVPMPVNPLENIYYAVTRTPLGRQPSRKSHPEQALTLEEALRAYTVNPAFAAHEETIKGSLTPGKLADVVILSSDIFSRPVADLLTTRVAYTLLGGRIVHQAAP